MPVLYIFAGLPGAGKSTLAQMLAEQKSAVYLRIDTMEQALREICAVKVYGEGYDLAYRLAADNLKLGLSVVADSCNPVELTRTAWEKVAADAGAAYLNIEIICSDGNEHRRRVETRSSTVPGLKMPEWKDVETREYEPWTRERIALDTSGHSVEESFQELDRALESIE